MPRIRSLKIGFFQNEHLCELSPWHRLLFEGLWLLADREGRLEDRPRRIKAELFPYDELDVDRLLIDLAEKGFVVRYTADGAGADGARYLAIPQFLKHQKPNIREAASLIPAPSFEQSTTLHVQDEGEWSLGSGLGNGLGEGNGGSADGALCAAGAPLVLTRAEDVMEAWNAVTKPPIPRCRELTSKRRRQIRSRLTERTLEEWVSVFHRIQGSAFCRGELHRPGEHANWCASFDWVMGSPDVAVKVLEGKYDDRVSTAPILSKVTQSAMRALEQAKDS